MFSGPSRQPLPALRAVRDEMLNADELQIRKIVSLSERGGQSHSWQPILDALRPRLAIMRPARSLRFSRLLFIPLDALIVPSRNWRPGQPSIPRSILESLSKTVQLVLGAHVETIEQVIAGHNTHDTEVIAMAGRMVWHRAGEILAQPPPPAAWEKTGLPLAAYAPLARGIATVLRRVDSLRYLLQENAAGVLAADERVIVRIITDLEHEPPEGCVMVFKLILGQLSHAVSLLRRLINLNPQSPDRVMLRTALDCSISEALVGMEKAPWLIKDLRDGSLADVGTQVRRIATLLNDIDNDTDAKRHRSRVRELREKLDKVCRDRCVEGMQSGLVTPLASASEAFDGAGQKQLESCARDLRMAEVSGRKLGSPAIYDALLNQAAQSVRAAAECGNLSSVRAVRLVEILLGPETAKKMYHEKKVVQQLI